MFANWPSASCEYTGITNGMPIATPGLGKDGGSGRISKEPVKLFAVSEMASLSLSFFLSCSHRLSLFLSLSLSVSLSKADS